MNSRLLARVAHLFLLAACTCLYATSLQAQGTGFIQVTCEPGVQVFLDGRLQGITRADLGRNAEGETLKAKR